MTLKLEIMGDNIIDLISQAEEFIAANKIAAASVADAVVSKQAAADEKAEQAAKLAAEHKKANANLKDGSTTDTFDGVIYGTKTTARNAWLDLKDGRVLAVKAGGRMPLESEIEKRITKKEYDAALEDGTDVALTITEVVKDWSEDGVENANEQTEDSKLDKDEEEEDAVADEEDETEEDGEEDSDEDYTLEEVKDLAKDVKEIDGGKDFIKELNEEYDVKRIAQLDEEELQEYADELVDFLDENEW